jgi:hypothetical protein
MTVPSAAKDRTAIMGEAAARRFHLASPATALILGGLVLALLVAGLPLGDMVHQLGASDIGQSALVLAFAAVGVAVAWHQPRNAMGWVLLGAAGFLSVNNDASLYSVADYRLHHGALPLGPVAVLVQPSWAPAIVLLGLAILLFPDGRLPSPRWRWVLGFYLAAGAFWLVGAFVIAAAAIIGHKIHVAPGGDLTIIDHPTGRAAWWGVVQNLFFPVLGVSWLASLSGQVVTYQRSGRERRQQLKWLMSGAAVCMIGGSLTLAFSNSHGILQVLSQIGTAGLIALPICIGVGILKYRLFEIDRLISRALAYVAVTGLLVGVYAGLVLLATRVLPFSSPVAVAGSTLAAAALFSPLRGRVQRAVDRRFNRARYDAELTVAAFAARLKDAVNLDSVRDDLAGVVHTVLEPAHVSVWIRGGTQ